MEIQDEKLKKKKKKNDNICHQNSERKNIFTGHKTNF